MHDTAYRLGTLALNIYADLKDASVLEIGSQSVNGSLRDNALPSTHYVGLDLEEGEGVDIVVQPGKPLPVDDASFDLVLASSVFEHDPAFWMTFLEMCRATKEGGYIYISAPSNGVVHRYPQDNWRFYPDSGKSLAKWAVSQGFHVTLVESFIADREADIWNDFVAVFRKGRITKSLPKVFLHEHVACSNVMTWKSKVIINPRDEPQDMGLLREANERAEDAARQRDEYGEQVGQLTGRLADVEAQAKQWLVERDALKAELLEAAKARHELSQRESELRQRQEEIEQTRSELAQLRSERDATGAQLAVREQKLHLETALRADAQAMAEQWKGLYEREQQGLAKLKAAEADLLHRKGELEKERSENGRMIGELKRALETAQANCRTHDERSKAHFDETAVLSRLLLEREQKALRAAEKVARLRDLHKVLSNRPRWWAILPRSSQMRMEQDRLRRLGLFDAQSYLQKNPDVAQSGMDPVFHYLNHGIDEDRQA